MLFYKGLEDIIFTRNQLFRCDELVILSGYLGPTPVERLKELPFHTTVIYGMYGAEGIRANLHAALKQKNRDIPNIDVVYSTLPIHSKCYVWKNEGRVVHALVGSANFSTNGLSTPYREVLAETTVDTFDPLDEYLKTILDRAIECENAVAISSVEISGGGGEETADGSNICTLPLYGVVRGNKVVFESTGINWGMATGAHVSPNDASIGIKTDHIRKYPKLFPKKQESPRAQTGLGRSRRHNDAIEVLWDDGTIMTCLLEGSQDVNVNGEVSKYPKQIASHPSKGTLGKYLRKRLNVPEGRLVTLNDLVKYGRDTITVSMQGDGIYFFDFSVNNHGG